MAVMVTYTIKIPTVNLIVVSNEQRGRRRQGEGRGLKKPHADPSSASSKTQGRLTPTALHDPLPAACARKTCAPPRWDEYVNHDGKVEDGDRDIHWSRGGRADGPKNRHTPSHRR